MTTALPVLLALALPAVALPHPCEVELAQMTKDLDAIRGAVATFERLKPSDNQRQMLAAAKSKYDLEVARTKEAQARCEKLVAAENPGAKVAAPAAAAAVPAPPVPATSPPPVAVPQPPVPAPAPVAAAPAAVPTPVPAAVPVAPVAPAAPAAVAPAVVATPCLTGSGKDTDCKGARICVNGACQDPPAR
jgi:hypothetical protein